MPQPSATWARTAWTFSLDSRAQNKGDPFCSENRTSQIRHYVTRLCKLGYEVTLAETEAA